MTGDAVTSDDIKRLRNWVEKRKAEYNLYKEQLKEAKRDFKKANQKHKDAKRARLFVQNVAQETQQNLEHSIANLVTSAFHSTFYDDPLDFSMQFVQRRNKTECDLYFKKNEKLMEPLFSEAGGAVDIASFSLRAAYLQLKSNRKVLLLDEPMKNISSDYMPNVAEMMRLIAHDLQFQIIMVTHITDLYKECADKIFRIKQGKLISEE